MSEAAYTLVGIGVGALLSLVGLWAGDRRAKADREAARSTATSEVRRQAYANLLSAGDAALTDYVDKTIDKFGMIKNVLVPAPSVWREAALVRLLGPTEVGEAAQAYADAVYVREGVTEAEDRFIEIAQPYALPAESAK